MFYLPSRKSSSFASSSFSPEIDHVFLVEAANRRHDLKWPSHDSLRHFLQEKITTSALNRVRRGGIVEPKHGPKVKAEYVVGLSLVSDQLHFFSDALHKVERRSRAEGRGGDPLFAVNFYRETT